MIRKYIKIITLYAGYTVLASFFLATILPAQQLSVKTSLDPKKILLGDWMKYKVEISYSKDVAVFWPAIPDTIGNFELVERSAIDSSFSDGNIIKKQTITITSFDSGTHTFPSFNVLFRKINDKTLLNATTDSFQVYVNIVAVDTSKAIKPIKAPIGLPLKFREILPYILIVVGIAAIILVLIYLLRKRKKKPLFIRPKPQIPPYILAIEKLKELEDRKLWQKGEVKKYHIELTDIVREYIENRYNFPALESTTDEIMFDIEKVISDKQLLSDLRSSLELSDLVKFAKLQPLPDENDKCLKASYELVNKTKVMENGKVLEVDNSAIKAEKNY